MTGFRIEGIDELLKKLDNIQRAAKKAGGQHSVPVKDLLTDDFMSRNTGFRNVQEMFDRSSQKMDSDDEVVKALKSPEWNAFVAAHTKFSTWEDLIEAAGAEWMRKQMSLK